MSFSISTKFQSAPHFSSEANLPSKRNFSSLVGFNPRLTSAARRTYLFAVLRRNPPVSIRASLQQRGERQIQCKAKMSRLVSIRASLQQRGERRLRCLLPHLNGVSIRASLQQRGERSSRLTSITPI